jgi:succinoglycan biosynthesis transport protein ExoP
MSDDASLAAARRRRWPYIVALLVLLALIGDGIYWFARPATASATALFRVRGDAKTLVSDQAEETNWETHYDILKKTQLALLKSKFLLTAALRDPKVASLSIFAGVRDQEEWLQDHLQASFPEGGEILSISLSGPASKADDLRRVVDAVSDAYKKEVLGQETSRKMTIHDMMERSLQNLNGEVKRKYEDYLDIAKGMGKTTGDGTDIEQQLNMKRIDRIEDEIAQLERDKIKMETGGDNKDEKFVAKRLEMLAKQKEELAREIQKRADKSVDLETRGQELKQLQQIANDMNIKLEKMDIDSQLPAQIQQVQAAVIEPKQFAGH